MPQRCRKHGLVGVAWRNDTDLAGYQMHRTTAILGTALFFVVVPCVLAGLIPWWMTQWEFRPAFLGLDLTRGAGVLLMFAGVPGIVDSFARFALEGLGTPAPVAPTRKLVVTGLYRYVRNPMYASVLAVILGQALLFGDLRLIIYALLFWLACHLFVLGYEEPTLERTFGAEYQVFRANVPRWIPRLTPWRGQ
jgi:protein-S-isoprenylcysteine O-methyltransferase Ste14